MNDNVITESTEFEVPFSIMQLSLVLDSLNNSEFVYREYLKSLDEDLGSNEIDREEYNKEKAVTLAILRKSDDMKDYINRIRNQKLEVVDSENCNDKFPIKLSQLDMLVMRESIECDIEYLKIVIDLPSEDIPQQLFGLVVGDENIYDVLKLAIDGYKEILSSIEFYIDKIQSIIDLTEEDNQE